MPSKTPQVEFQLSNPVHFLALGFGAGLLRPAPGTWGTLVAIPLYLGLLMISTSATVYLGVTAAALLLGIWLCDRTARDVGVHDHSAIVWDEIVGFVITMIAIIPSWQNILLGFLLFRLFDILKPWPISLLDKHVHGGFGIMIDDVLAGIAACVVLHLLQGVIPLV